ncbi:hypothetical protein HZS_844, partial [Henneguya salminicola]
MVDKNREEKDENKKIHTSEDNVKERKRKYNKESSDSDTEKEQARVKDIAERDEFSARIREKEKRKAKEGNRTKGNDFKKQLMKNITDNKEVVKILRDKARKEYVKKRKMEKIDALKEDLIDEENLYDVEELTEREIYQREYKKKVVSFAEESLKINEKQKIERYEIPKENEKLIDHFDEKLDEHQSEQKKWEKEKLDGAIVKFGKDKDDEETQNNYDIVMDQSQIAFVMSESLPGTYDNKNNATKLKINTIQETRKSLPIYKYRDSLLQALEEYQIIIIEGETGSGKTTQIPQYLYEAGYTKDKKKIGCTQPRRVAAMSVATRVSEEMNVKLGSEVGYSIRFEDCTSERTIIKYMTDGMMLREFLSEPDLNAYSVIIIDEAHERTLHTDVLFGLVKDIARFRKDLKLLISSATLDADKFSNFFDDAPIFRIPGRRYPVDLFYTKAPEANYIDACVVTILQIHLTQPPGDVLVFLTGQEEIENCQEMLHERIRKLGSKIGELIILTIYSNLPTDLQAKIFETTPEDARKIILATNIAETSLTIDGIVYVIDPGFCKQKTYNPKSGVESLIVTPISKASAQQRAGRAGRVAPGKCFRLYTEWAFEKELEDNIIPEIQRTNLGNVVLLLKSLGINDLLHFDFMDPPPAETLILALEQLYALGALNHLGELTKTGRRMAELPVDPCMSKMLLASENYKCSEQAISIASMLSVNASIFYRPKERAIHADNARRNFYSTYGDHIMLLSVYDQWKDTAFSSQWCFENFIQHRSMKRARDIREQLTRLMEHVEVELTSNPTDSISIRKCITAGYFYHTAKLTVQPMYKTIKYNQSVSIHPTSSLFDFTPKWVVYHELVLTTKEYMRSVSQIECEWLLEVAPHYYKEKDLEDIRSKKMPKGKGLSCI